MKRFEIQNQYLKMLNREVAGMIACPANSVPTVKQEVEQIGGFVASKNYGDGTAEALSHFFRPLLEG